MRGPSLLIILLAACVAFASGVRAADTVDIAVIVPLSGPNATVGEMIVNATKLAIEDINGGGGIKSLGGAKLNAIIADATADPQGAVTTTERVLSQNKVAGAYGLALSPITTAALPAFVKHHIPVVTSAIQGAVGRPTTPGLLPPGPKARGSQRRL